MIEYTAECYDCDVKLSKSGSLYTALHEASYHKMRPGCEQHLVRVEGVACGKLVYVKEL